MGTMNAKDGNKYQMGLGSYELTAQHPLADPEGAEAVTRLQALLQRFRELAAEQHEAGVTGRANVQRQAEIRQVVARDHLPHLANVGRLAGRDLPELVRTFTPRRIKTHLQFRTVTGSMFDAARSNQDALRKHGLSVTMLDDLEKVLAEYDALGEALNRHHTTRAGASVDLHRVAKDIVAVVRVLDGHNRLRWRDDARMLAAWRTASTIRRTGTSSTPEAGPPAAAGSPDGGSAPVMAAADGPAA
jgi:hypothetical protein